MLKLTTTLSILALLTSIFFISTVKLTIYDDGFSCPGNCDAHVVFDSTMNGTKYAHSPTSPPGTFEPCDLNTECRICFDDDAGECLNVMYRGGGPPPNTFDLTPAFYEKHCAESQIPLALAFKCRELEAQARRLDGRLNCIRNPEHVKCAALIQTARQQQAEDRPLYEQCKIEGEIKFNQGRPIAQQRSSNCAYERRGTGGPNSLGMTWKRLLPGACRDNTFVGRYGTDCCNGQPSADGPLGVECQGFYPKP